MKVFLTSKGHKNLLGEHKNTFEFTKDDYLTKRGDCIIGIKADLIPKAFQGKIEIFLQTNNHSDTIQADANPDFSSTHEMVIRKSDYLDKRTFAINATKSALEIDRNLINELKNSDSTLKIIIKNL